MQTAGSLLVRDGVRESHTDEREPIAFLPADATIGRTHVRVSDARADSLTAPAFVRMGGPLEDGPHRPPGLGPGQINQLGRAFPALSYEPTDADRLLLLEHAPRTVRASSKILIGMRTSSEVVP